LNIPLKYSADKKLFSELYFNIITGIIHLLYFWGLSI
jgi:hypothetical protein